MSNQRQNILKNPWLELLFRWIVGLTFIYASFHKIMAPADFAKIIYGYALFPHATINLIAIILPFIELVAGISLISGIFPRAAALIVIEMLGFFIAAIAFNLARGHEFDCGCFSADGAPTTSAAWMALIRDIFLLAMAVHVFKNEFRETRKFITLRG